MQADLPKVLTPEEIAELTKTSVNEIVAELTDGRLHGFRIGDKWRITAAEFVAFMAGPSNGSKIANSMKHQGAGIDLNSVEWAERARFPYLWPDGKTKESYKPAYEADVPLSTGPRHFLIGHTRRKSAGLKGRARVVVFLGDASRIVPVVEFAGTNDFASTGQIASIIKKNDNRHVRSLADLPPEYQGIPTALFSDVVVGKNAARSIAVIAHKEDRNLMLRHALIRAAYKGLILPEALR